MLNGFIFERVMGVLSPSTQFSCELLDDEMISEESLKKLGARLVSEDEKQPKTEFNIEPLNMPNPDSNYKVHPINGCDKILADKIDQLIQWAKQVDKRLSDLENTK